MQRGSIRPFRWLSISTRVASKEGNTRKYIYKAHSASMPLPYYHNRLFIFVGSIFQLAMEYSQYPIVVIHVGKHCVQTFKFARFMAKGYSIIDLIVRFIESENGDVSIINNCVQFGIRCTIAGTIQCPWPSLGWLRSAIDMLPPSVT